VRPLSLPLSLPRALTPRPRARRWYHLRHGEHAFAKDVYPTEVEYFADLAKAYREELADLYDAGCRNVQFDDPLLAYFVRPISLSIFSLSHTHTRARAHDQFFSRSVLRRCSRA